MILSRYVHKVHFMHIMQSALFRGLFFVLFGAKNTAQTSLQKLPIYNTLCMSLGEVNTGALEVNPVTTLAKFDNHLMDGLLFCKMAYSVFANIRKQENGIERIRLRNDKLSKKLIEEILPLARYIQARYNLGQQIKVRWVDGNQKYDARILFSGGLVEHLYTPKNQYVEITTAVHEKDHILRRLINEGRPTFGVKGIEKMSGVKGYQSHPYVYRNDEAEVDLSNKILEMIQVKDAKDYPFGTVLIVQCFLSRGLLQDEWDHAINLVKNNIVAHKFYEIFLFDANHQYSSTLFGDRQIRLDTIHMGRRR